MADAAVELVRPQQIYERVHVTNGRRLCAVVDVRSRDHTALVIWEEVHSNRKQARLWRCEPQTKSAGDSHSVFGWKDNLKRGKKRCMVFLLEHIFHKSVT